MKATLKFSIEPGPKSRLQTVLLISGILSSLWYIAINIYVPSQYEGYSMMSHTVSELSAIGAPTRKLWILLVLVYPVLFAAFGVGVLLVARDRAMRAVGFLILFYCAFNLYWPPMHQRGLDATLTDVLHITWASVTVLLMIIMMGFGATALGMPFRVYTIASIGLHVLFGVLTFLEAPNIPVNGPTPLIGVWERINIAIFMLWVAVLAVVLLRTARESDSIVGRASVSLRAQDA